METESFRLWIKWETRDIVHIVFLTTCWDRLINTGGGESKSYFECLRVNESLKNSFDQTYIFVIGDTTTIVDGSTENVQHLEWNLIIHIREDLKLPPAHIEIFISESVCNVPTDRTELTSVLHDGVEERESEDKLLKLVGFARVV